MKIDFKNNRFRNETMATVFTIVVTVVLLVLNTLVGELSEKFNLSADLSEGNVYSISKESKNYLSNMSRNVEIHVLTDEGSLSAGNEYATQLYQILCEYNSYRKIKVDYTDLTLNPTFVQKYTGYDLSAGDVIVECGDRRIVTKLADMLESSTSIDYSTYKQTTTIEKSNAEQTLTNAIIFVSTENLTKIAILKGFSDVSYDGFAQLLNKNSFEIVEQSLIMEDIDPEADVAVLYGLQNDLTEETMNKIDLWLNNNGKQGKTLFVFTDANATEFSNTNVFLKEWGIEIETGIAVETDSKYYYFYPYYPVAKVQNEIFDIANADNPIVMALSKPLATVKTNANYTISTILGLESTAAVLKEDKTVENNPNLDVMLMSKHTNYGEQTNASYVVVSGSYQAFSSTLLTDSTFENAEFLLNCFNTITGRDNAVIIAPKNFSNSQHALSNSAVIVRGILFALVLPSAIAVAGIVVWIKRKNR